MIRLITEADKEWVLGVAERCYSANYGWIREDAAHTFDTIMADKGSLFVRGEKTFLYACLAPRLCDYNKRDAFVELLAGEGKSGLEPLKLLRVAKDWANFSNVDRLTISSVTEHKFGELLMRKLGAVPRLIYDIYKE